MKNVFYLSIAFVLGFTTAKITYFRSTALNQQVAQMAPSSNDNLSSDKSTLHVKSTPKTQTTQTDAATKTNQVTSLYDEYTKARINDKKYLQEEILNKILKLNPDHELAFKVSVQDLQDKNDWAGAHKRLKECVESYPASLFCHKRLSNIRSSTTEDKIEHGKKCLELSKNDPWCRFDLAMAYQKDRSFQKSNFYLQDLARKPNGLNGYYNKEYILYQMGLNFEELKDYEKALDSFIEACRLNMKKACQKADQID